MSEGRWLADIILLLAGGSGVQVIQSIVGFAILALNGVLLSVIFGATSGFQIFLVSATLLLHPAILDYFSFTSDAIGFVLADAFLLAGIVALGSIQRFSLAVALCSLLFMASIAVYQPKLAVMATLAVLWCALPQRASGGRWGMGAQAGTGMPLSRLSRVFRAAAACLIGILLYLLSLKVIGVEGAGARTQINGVVEMSREFLRSFVTFGHYFILHVNYLPQNVRLLPAALCLLALALTFAGEWRSREVKSAVLIVLLLALLPPSLSLAFIVNDQAPQFAGRLLSAHAYFVAALAAFVLGFARLRPFSTILVAALVYFFAIHAAQEITAASLRNDYQMLQLNRIVQAVERTVPDLYERRRALVVIGDPVPFDASRIVRESDDGYHSQLDTTMFIHYRQVLILNSLLGHDVFVSSDEREKEIAKAACAGRRPWPAAESVFLTDDLLVILLEPLSPDVRVTW